MYGRREVIGVAVLAAGVLGVVGALALFAGGGGGSGGPADATVAATPRPVFAATTEDDFAIEALARRSIEVLPAGQWPSLYDDFTAEFQARCPRDEFEAGGAATAQDFGEQLQLLGYRRMEAVTMDGDSADGIIIGHLGGSEYSVASAFQRVAGVWKLSPAADTSGCAAFNRLEDAGAAASSPS